MAGCYMIANHGESAAVFIEKGRKKAPRCRGLFAESCQFVHTSMLRQIKLTDPHHLILKVTCQGVPTAM